MKNLSKIYLIILIMLIYSQINAQIDEDDSPFFGLSRSLNSPLDQYDMGEITSQKAQATFTYTNTSKNREKFIWITPIDGVAVIIDKTYLMPTESTKIHIIIDKNYFKEHGDFQLNIGFKIMEISNYGIKIQKQFYYSIKGKI